MPASHRRHRHQPARGGADRAGGIDAIVAQGIEAGSHRGVFDPEAADERLSTAVLVRLLVQRARLPVIAAGGIAERPGHRGGAGSWRRCCATRYRVRPMSGISHNAGYRELLKGDRASATRLTAVISGAAGTRHRQPSHPPWRGGRSPCRLSVAYDAAKQLNAAAAKHGNNAFAAHWAGQGAPLARALPAAQLVQTLLEEMAF
ncbi:MAG: nitronate monooxygenase [Rhodospirillales bacterium]